MSRLYLLLTVSLVLTGGCGAQDLSVSKLREHWDRANEPLRMLPDDFVFEFSELPLKSTLSRQPWADSYWPSRRGGLAQRWMDDVPGHEVTPVTLEVAKNMSQAELARLSPAEKFDVFVGDKDLSLFRNELNRTDPSDGAWFGICHGWASASMAFDEPKAVVVKGPSGIEVPFGSTDVKALLSLHSAEYARMETRFMASRCDVDLSKNPEEANNPECRDVNAGSFHLVLANLIGRKGEGFVADVTRDLEVWNQPVSGYESRILEERDGRSRGADPLTVKEITVETVLFYGSEIYPTWNSTGPNMGSKTYRYRLELNRRGRVVGGEWLTDFRPDFLWANSVPRFLDSRPNQGSRLIKWSQFEEIYLASVKSLRDAPNPADGR